MNIQEKIKYIGCSNEILLDFVEFQFDENMNWDNYCEYWIEYIFDTNNKNKDECIKGLISI